MAGLAHAGPLDWPMLNQGPTHTRYVDGTGRIETPAVLWRARVGGSNAPIVARDVTADGDIDIVMLIGGRAVCKSPETGAVLWATESASFGHFQPLDAPDAHDLNNDGGLELIVSKAGVGDARIWVVDGRTGAVRWSFGEGLGPQSGTGGVIQVEVVELDDDAERELLVYIPNNEQGGVFYRFDIQPAGGAEFASLTWQTDGNAYAGGNRFTLMDLDGDGLRELVCPMGDDLHVHSLVDGSRTGMHTGWLGDLSFTPFSLHLRVVQADADEADELYVDFDAAGGNRLVGVYDMTPDGPAVLWQLTPEGAYRSTPPADLDGDGREEVVVSHAESGEWALYVLEIATGDPIASIPELVVVGQLGGTLLATKVVDAQPVDFGTLRSLAFDGEALQDAWPAGIPDVSFVDTVDWLGDGTEQLVLQQSSDGSGAADRLLVVHVTDGQPLQYASYAYPKSKTVQYKTYLPTGPTDRPTLAVFSGDGAIDLLAPPLAPSEPAQALGVVGKRVFTGDFTPPVLASSGDGGARLFTLDSAGRALALRPQAASPSTAPAVSLMGGAESGLRVAAVVDVDGDGTLERFVSVQQDGLHSWRLYAEDGALLWEYAPDDALYGLETGAPGTGADLDGDGVLDFYLQIVLGTQRTGVPISGATGQPLGWTWEAFQNASGHGTSYTPPVMTDLNGDGAAEVIVSRYADRVEGAAIGDTDALADIHVFDGATGATLHAQQITIAPGRFAVADVDGDSTTTELAITWWNGQAILDYTPEAGFTVRWSEASTGPVSKGRPLVGDLDGDGLDDLLHTDPTVATVRARRGTDGAPLWDEEGVRPGERLLAAGRAWVLLDDGMVRDSETDDVVDMPTVAAIGEGGALVADLTGDGSPTALFAGADGWIYALNATTGRLHWSWSLGFGVGAVLAADVTDNGEVEVVVAASDGHIYALGPQVDLGLIEEVRDGNGDDVDDVGSAESGIAASLLSVNWSAPTGGSVEVAGYHVRLLTDTGAVVLDWWDVGDETAMRLEGLVRLVPGVVYRAVVWPYAESGSGVPVMSDGFWFTDTDGDGVLDGDETTLGTRLDAIDSDGDGLDDWLETMGGQAIDTDGDLTIDALDLDSDDDGLPDSDEGATDLDGDTIANFRDTDDDGDAIPTTIERLDAETFGADRDGDGVPSWYDPTSDLDDLSDLDEGTGDLDADGIPNYLDNDDATPLPEDPIESPPVFDEPSVSSESTGCQSQDGPVGGAFWVLGLAVLASLSTRRARRVSAVLATPADGRSGSRASKW